MRAGDEASDVVDDDIDGRVRVTRTPAEVPIHNMSLTGRREVTLRHAVLCCLMISSQFVNILPTAAVQETWIN